MKIKTSIIIIALCLCAATWNALHAGDFEEISILPGTATYKLTPAKYNSFANPISAYVKSGTPVWKATTLSVSGTDIRLRWDAKGTPTASSGHLLSDGAYFGLTAFRDNANLVCVNKSGGTGTLTVTYDDE